MRGPWSAKVSRNTAPAPTTRVLPPSQLLHHHQMHLPRSRLHTHHVCAEAPASAPITGPDSSSQFSSPTLCSSNPVSPTVQPSRLRAPALCGLWPHQQQRRGRALSCRSPSLSPRITAYLAHVRHLQARKGRLPFIHVLRTVLYSAGVC